MNKLYLFFILFIILSSCKQADTNRTTMAYDVDSGIQEQLNKKTTIINMPSIGTSVMGSIDLKLYKNDSLILNTYSKGESLECMIMSSITGDTALISGFTGMTGGLGYRILIFEDTCIIRYFVKTDAMIYKLKITDSLNFGVSVPSIKYKLILASNPIIKKGEVIKGIVELTSDYYYESSNNKDDKYKAELTGYFVTEPLQSFNDKYEESLKKSK